IENPNKYPRLSQVMQMLLKRTFSTLFNPPPIFFGKPYIYN
ncbi:unnamed protein product, partial [marine sediment metagenome]